MLCLPQTVASTVEDRTCCGTSQKSAPRGTNSIRAGLTGHLFLCTGASVLPDQNTHSPFSDSRGSRVGKSMLISRLVCHKDILRGKLFAWNKPGNLILDRIYFRKLTATAQTRGLPSMLTVTSQPISQTKGTQWGPQDGHQHSLLGLVSPL